MRSSIIAALLLPGLTFAQEPAKKEFKAFTGQLISAAGTTSVGAVLYVVDRRTNEVLTIDENGKRNWVPTGVVQPLPEAMETFKSRLRKDDADINSIFGLQAGSNELRRYDDALSYSDMLLKLRPKSVGTYISRSMVLLRLDRYADAVAACDVGLEVAPRNADLFVNRGFAHKKLGERDKALRDYAQAIELADDVIAYGNRATIFRDEKDYERALSEISKGLQVRETAILYRHRGYVYLDQEQYDEAVTALERSTELNPSLSTTWFELGRAYTGQNERQKAVEAYTECLRLDPSDTSALTNRGFVYGRLGKHKQAKADSEAILLVEPLNEIATTNLARDCVNLGQHEEAIQHYSVLLGMGVRQHTAYSFRGDSFMNLNEYEKAAADYRAAIEINANASLHHATGYCQMRLKKFDSAIEHFSKSLEMAPNTARTLRQRGNTYLKLKDYSKAATDFAASLKVDDKSIFAALNLAMIRAGSPEPANRNLKEADEFLAIAMRLFDGEPTAEMLSVRSLIVAQLESPAAALPIAKKASAAVSRDNPGPAWLPQAIELFEVGKVWHMEASNK